VDFYINRTFVALSLLLLATILDQRMRMLHRIEEARDLQARQNAALRDTDAALRGANEELERRVEQELERRLKVEQSLQQAQKMEAIGQLTGGVAHDFNNMLTTVIGNLELIAAASPIGDSRRRLAENALRGAEQGARLTEHLLSFARRQRLSPEVVEIDKLLGAVMALARRAVSEETEVSLELEPGIWRCRVDQAWLQSALLNLVINARDAMPGGGRLVIGAGNATVGKGADDLAEGEYVRLSVRDTGSGMTPDVVARAFEPFFTTKPVGKGSGLGLSMVYGFAKQSGGAVRIDSVPGAGTAMHLYLPRTTSTAIAEPVAQPPVPRPARPVTVLVVEDDAGVRQFVAESLENLGYRILRADDAASAMSLLERSAIDLVLTDIVMPGRMSGLELAGEIHRLYRDLPVLLMTGYAEAVDRAAAFEWIELLRKPFGARALGAKVHQLLNAPGERQSA
jgi:signal transduction histidine kinase